MASQRQSLPSFASIVSFLSIVFYCAGFLKAELELNEQKKRIIDFENNEGNKPSDVSNRDELTKNTYGKSFPFWFNILRKEYHTECLFYVSFNIKSCESGKFCI